MLIELPPLITIILDFIAWFIFHMSIGIAFNYAPAKWFEKDNFLFKTKKWEKGGTFWNKYTKVKKWKNHLPDGAAVFNNGFRKKNIKQSDSEYFKMFIVEYRRAEMTHYISMLPAPLFFIWNPFWVGIIMIIYAVLINTPCIIAQRYNRPRFERLISKK